MTLLAVLLAVCVAGFQDGDDIGVFVSVLVCVWVVPPIVRTALLARRRAAQGRPLSMRRHVASYGLSFLLTVCFTSFVFLATLAAILINAFCCGMINFGAGLRPPPSPSEIWQARLVPWLVWGPCLLVVFFFIRWRFRRDLRQ